MLGKLFNLTAGAGAGSVPSSHAGQPSAPPEPVSSLESVQEDLHTRSLLYPDAQTLFQNHQDQVFPLPNSPHLPAAALASAFDYDGDLDLDMRDVRVLIMQDGISSVPASLLYDSQPTPPPPTPTIPDRPSTMSGMAHLSHGLQDASRRMPTSPRKPSLSHTTRPLVIQPDNPQLRQSATFDRRPSLHSRSHSRLETDAQRAHREYAEEISVFSSCIFGNSELLAYRGTSTKVHVLPSEQRAPDLSSLALHDGRGSLGRSSMRSSKLSQSFSSESAAMFPPPTSSSSSLAAGSRTADRKKVLITRLFPVTLPNDDDVSTTMTPHSRFSEESGSSGYPFPPTYSDDTHFQKKKKKAQLKQKRTPMYAVALVVNLPQPPPPLTQASSASRSTFRGPGSYSEQDSFPSSYGSGRRVGWALATAAVGGHSGNGSGSGSGGGSGNGLGIDVAMGETAHGGGTLPSGVIGTTTDLEERMDPITQHWDIVMRALTQMQTVASAAILTLLRASDVASPEPYPPSASAYARTATFSGRQDALGGPMKMPKTNAKLITLMPNALMDMERITREVDSAKTRIAVGLRALRVVTGQNRWGIWREEARWVSRWAASVRERKLQPTAQAQALPLHLQPPPLLPLPPQQGQDPFLYNLLTAFLSTHTDWLQALSPARYRKRHLMLQSSKNNDDSVSARTIVVSRDKIAARRLVFLLSAFLPASQTVTNSVRVHRPSTSMSWGALSQSPPASFVVPIIKEQSLRRKINRRGPGGSGRRSSHSRNLSLQGQAIPGGIPARSASMSVTGVPAPLAHLNLHRGQHERRPSDTASIRTANFPFTGNDFTTRKSSAATMTTVTSDATVPHFATMQRSDSTFSVRPESSASSAAADDLKRTLQRGDSTTSQQGSGALSGALSALQQQQGLTSPGLDSDTRNQSLRWGSMLTGFLSGRRRDSTSSNTGGGSGGGGGRHSRNSSITSWDPLGRRNSLLPPPSPRKPQQDTASRQAKVTAGQHASHGVSGTGPHAEEAIDPHTPRLSHDSPNLVGSTFAGIDSFRRAPEPDAGFDSPVKATASADDGVIDVDIAFPDYIRSFETAVSSPSSSGFLSTPGFGSGLDAFEQSCRVSVDGDLPANVAGWLQNYHPDFCLQAIPPQGNLMAHIKESMRTEASSSGYAFEPETGGQPSTAHLGERWADISSAIVVDATKLTITRVSYSRLVRPKATPDVSTPNSANSPPTPVTASLPTTVPSQEMEQLDERFVETPIVSTDSVLTKALERVIAQGVAGSGASAVGAGGGVSSVGGAGVGGSFEHVNIHSGESTVDSSGLSTDNSARSSRSASIRRGRRDSSSVGPDEPYPPARPRYVNPSPTAPFSPLTPLGLEEVPRAECKTVILSALEEIVRDVVQSKDRDDQADDGLRDHPATSSKDDGDKEAPSVLRSAVQSWLENVDMGEV
ncbi:uncharacterized protein SPSK_08316 [Sporothrix schenckii 1099-18]|uniref:Folliculin-interacting protein N-terminal domain-containing protein n=1 Tax=Sporothrix schenckii 1099-18 TaxID=1397361 RepID=A0A0F2MA34_SPOSC|nr:uncharacterized protein SPSK_08316 [Sporothrix schenckii 1099-18]KJR85695.1 hypothetical protein SPSK_08316 [Sporothrix schenckii 1099-18]